MNENFGGKEITKHLKEYYEGTKKRIRKELKKRGRIKKLKELIKKYNKEYYEEDNPSVSDDVYDSLKNELKKLELPIKGSLLISITHTYPNRQTELRQGTI